jgi:hypothetical protein
MEFEHHNERPLPEPDTHTYPNPNPDSNPNPYSNSHADTDTYSDTHDVHTATERYGRMVSGRRECQRHPGRQQRHIERWRDFPRRKGGTGF